MVALLRVPAGWSDAFHWGDARGHAHRHGQLRFHGPGARHRLSVRLPDFWRTGDRACVLPREGIFSQLVAGGGWVTTIWLINRSSAPVQTSLIFHADDGTALLMPFSVTQPSGVAEVEESTLNETIAPNTTLVVATLSAGNNTQGWVDVLGNGALSGFLVFTNGITETSVPLQSQIGNSISLPFDNTNGASTGVALVNLAGAPANITATIWDMNGNQIGTQPVAVALTE